MKRLLAGLLIALHVSAIAAPPTTITDLSATIANNSPAGTDAIGATLDDYLRAGFGITRRFATASTVTSAGVMDIGAVEAEYLSVTGATTVTSLGNVAAGVKRVLVFENALSLAHSASLILPGGATITTAAGDVAMFRSLGSSTWRAEAYTKASGSPAALVTVTDGGTGRATGVTPYGLVAVGTTATGAQQTIAPGPSASLLIGNGSSALASWIATTGSGVAVLSSGAVLASPVIASSAITPSSSFGFLNENATTVSAFGASTTLRLGAGSGTATIANSTLNANAITATSFNGNTITSGTGTLTLANGATASFATTLNMVGFAGTTAETPNASVVSLGYLNIPINSQSAAYTTVLADAGKTILHPSTDANARTYTIDGTINYPLGTAITFVNMTSQVITVTSTNVVNLCSTGSAVARTVSQYGVATALKVKEGIGTTGAWLICGTGVN